MRHGRRILTFCLSVFTANVAFACSCIAPGPVCSIQMGTETIFRGTVIERTLIPNIQTITKPDGSTQQIFGNGRFRVRFAVAETFSGKPSLEQIVFTNQQGSMCGFSFQEGREYVVFASMHEDQLWTSHCTRTALLEAGSDNEAIRWMRARATAPPGSEILGKVLLPRDSQRKTVPATIHLSGPTEKLVQTDPDGQYRASGLLPGEYTLSVSLPPGFAVPAPMSKVSVQEKGCAERNWYVTYEGQVSGRVRDADGKPVADLRMFLEPKIALPPGYVQEAEATTQLDGTYRFEHLSPGQYLLVARNASALTEDSSAPLYYPHSDRVGAKVIDLGESKELTGYDFALGKLKSTLSVRVTVLEPDGSPAPAGMMLFAFPNRTRGDKPTRTAVTDAAGVALLPLQKQQEYAISVALDGHHQNCGFLTRTFSEMENSATIPITAPDKCPR